MSKLPQELFPFFKELEENNNRDWFEIHKSKFKKIESWFVNFFCKNKLK